MLLLLLLLLLFALRHGTRLFQLDPAGFERMRLVVGYYDLPQNRHRRRPDPPSHVTVNNMQVWVWGGREGGGEGRGMLDQ